MSGVPVPTLRVWETRYAAFDPQMSQGGHRQYTDDDVLRATLLRRLTAQGHSISSIANHDAARLNLLLLQHIADPATALESPPTGQVVTAAVVGLALASQLSAGKFKQVFSPNQLKVIEIWEDLDAALAPQPQVHPQILIVQVNALHALVQAALQRLTQRTRANQVIVCYRFGQEPVAHALRQAGVVLRRGPVSEFELSDLVRSALMVPAPNTSAVAPAVQGVIPARKYDDATLARMASISNNVLCECPRHVSEIISQLVSFEQYSQECLSKSADDAHLHAHLHAVSGSARALFEQALEMVAQHEGLDLGSAEFQTLLK